MVAMNDFDIEQLRIIGRIVADTLQFMISSAEPGMSTLELDAIGARCLAKMGARSAPILTYNFPGHTCISVNHQAAHGIPSELKLEAGDLVNIDVSAELNGYFADTGGSFIVPPQKPALVKLCEATREAMYAGIAAARADQKISEIGKAIERVARKRGYSIIENLSSHGVGQALHEEPREILSYFDPMDKRILTKGMVITVEPFLSTGPESVTELGDGWTLAVNRKHRAAQYEHTLVVTEGEPLIMTNPSPAGSSLFQ